MGRKIPQWLLDATSDGNNKNLKKVKSSPNINTNSRKVECHSNDSRLSDVLSSSRVNPDNVNVDDKSAKNENKKNDCMETDDESFEIGMQSDSNVKMPIASDHGVSTPPERDSCTYGVKCFRRNPLHRAEFAHVGDSDYSHPTFPDAAPGTPPCPWGGSCYRRNPEHFIEFSHSPADI